MTMKRTMHGLANGLMMVVLATAVSCNNAADNTATGGDSTDNNNNNSTATANNNNRYAEAAISGVKADTAVTGTARFEQMEHGTGKMSLELTIPTKANQQVAVHLHEHGNCGDSAKAAHGHWNPTGAAHGKWGEGAFHSGDIGNVELDGSGKG